MLQRFTQWILESLKANSEVFSASGEGYSSRNAIARCKALLLLDCGSLKSPFLVRERNY